MSERLGIGAEIWRCAGVSDNSAVLAHFVASGDGVDEECKRIKVRI